MADAASAGSARFVDSLDQFGDALAADLALRRQRAAIPT
jgi:hypothetical protein